MVYFWTCQSQRLSNFMAYSVPHLYAMRQRLLCTKTKNYNSIEMFIWKCIKHTIRYKKLNTYTENSHISQFLQLADSA